MKRLTHIVFCLAFMTIGTAEAWAQIGKVTKDIAPIDAPFEMPELQRPSFPDTTFNIRDYGAEPMSGDSSFKNTAAFHKAIEAAYNTGGGTVRVPKGDWLTGPIHLKSNINLSVAEGATILL